MANNTILSANSGVGDTIRDIDRAGVKTPVSLLDVGGAAGEALVGDPGVELPVKIKTLDGPANDAFARLRVSQPATLFDAQMTYDLQPLLYEQITAETGATIAYDSTNRMALMTFAATPVGGKAYMQTYEYFRYQPGKSQLIFTTYNFKAQVADVLKFIGYSDGTNGIEFQNDGTKNQFVIYSGTANGNQVAEQADWNLDTLDGDGPSGITLDISKTQLLVIDFQALYIGRVRCGFSFAGKIVYVHEFDAANLLTVPYMQNANLPVRGGMISTATGGTVSTTMNHICSSVSSEGGIEDTHGYTFTAEGTVTAGSGVDTHILSIQPKATFNSIPNRSKFQLESVEVLVTGTNPVLWKLCLGQALTGETLTDVNATYSAVQTVAGALSGSPAIILASGYNPTASTGSSTTVTKQFMNRYPITLDAAGAARIMGRLTILVQGIGGNSATRCKLNWREVR